MPYAEPCHIQLCALLQIKIYDACSRGRPPVGAAAPTWRRLVVHRIDSQDHVDTLVEYVKDLLYAHTYVDEVYVMFRHTADVLLSLDTLIVALKAVTAPGRARTSADIDIDTDADADTENDNAADATENPEAAKTKVQIVGYFTKSTIKTMKEAYAAFHVADCGVVKTNNVPGPPDETWDGDGAPYIRITRPDVPLAGATAPPRRRRQPRQPRTAVAEVSAAPLVPAGAAPAPATTDDWTATARLHGSQWRIVFLGLERLLQEDGAVHPIVAALRDDLDKKLEASKVPDPQ